MKKLLVFVALAWFIILVATAAQAQTRDSGQELLSAAAAGNVGKVKGLLAAGANIETTNQMGATPLMWAALNGKPDVVALLLERGANLNARTRSGVTALGAAASKGHAEVVKLLLRRGADMNARDAKGRTALDIAQAGGFMQVVELLNTGGSQTGMAGTKKSSQRSQMPPPGPMSDQSSAGPVGVVTRVDLPENCLRIRSGPGVNYEKVGCAHQGQSLQLTGAVQNGWAQVQEPVQGWVSGGQIAAEGLFPPKQTTSGYSGSGSQGYSTGSDTDAPLDFDRSVREADRDIRRLRSQYPDGYGPYFGPRGGIIIGPRGGGIIIGR